MREKVLIVEDQWVEASALQAVLEEASYLVTGVAKSVDQARELISEQRPDIVLLDIVLKDSLTGVDLAGVLSAENIPFIFLTANADEDTFLIAKATNPYGFIVKPYQEREILLAIEIAAYRHKNVLDLLSRQQQWIKNTLSKIVLEEGDKNERLNSLLSAFEPIIPFDLVIIDLESLNDDLKSLMIFQRDSDGDYNLITDWEILEELGLTFRDVNTYRRENTDPEITVVLDLASADTDFRKKMYLQLIRAFGVQSALHAPLFLSGKQLAGISFYSLFNGILGNIHKEILKPVLSDVFKLFLAILERQKQRHLNISGKEGSQMKPSKPVFEGIVGKSAALRGVLEMVTQVAGVDSTVLILGETGVGKEGLASAVHELSERSSKPFVKINCAAIPGTLIEAELFGYERGAFTGASERRAGKFEMGQGGTIFLDEVGEIPLDVQSKLLRVLQEKEFERIGGRSTIKIDVRIIAATNRNLYDEVAAGRFRIDLYYRLNVFPITLPPLRNRKEDIPLLVNHFLKSFSAGPSAVLKKFSKEAMRTLLDHSWPGNIRELQHVVERNILLNDQQVISEVELPGQDEQELLISKVPGEETVIEDEKTRIESALRKSNGRISGNSGAAKLLAMTPAALSSKMKRMGIVWKYNLD